MSVREFIRQHRESIDRVIRDNGIKSKINDKERRLWILNDWSLYCWARRTGVKL